MCDTCVVSRESRVPNTKALGFNTPAERGATQSLIALCCSRLHITAEALRQLQDDTPNSARIPTGAPTVNEGGSPKCLEEVDEFALDLPALETHAAQLAASQSTDGSASGSNEGAASAASTAALQRRAQLKISLKLSTNPMATVPEEQAQASEADSYRSAEEIERAEEQSEQPPDE
eukprot:5942586-Amphidinium_carterae.1